MPEMILQIVGFLAGAAVGWGFYYALQALVWWIVR